MRSPTILAREPAQDRSLVRWIGAVICTVLMSGAAGAQDRSQFTLFNPTPSDQMRSFSTDRPTKSNVPYTVPAGHFQYEGNLFGYSYNDTSVADTTTRSWLVANPTFKLGLLDNVDFEVSISAFNSVQATTRSTGATSGATGFGNTVHTRQDQSVRQRRRAFRFGNYPLCAVAHGTPGYRQSVRPGRRDRAPRRCLCRMVSRRS